MVPPTSWTPRSASSAALRSGDYYTDYYIAIKLIESNQPVICVSAGHGLFRVARPKGFEPLTF